MYKLLMVEDDPEEASVLQGHIRRYDEQRHVGFRVSWLKTAVDFVADGGRYDLVFMDIDLPGINGMEAAHLLRSYDQTTPLIFVTNLAQFAIKGYEVDALDFLVKPVSYYDFAMRMDKALRVIERNTGKSVLVQTAEGTRVIPLGEVVFVEVADHELVYHLEDQEPISYRGSLSKVERDVEGGPLVRISNSCLVNAEHIRSIRKESLVMTTGDELYFSRSRKKQATAAITDFLGRTR